MANPLYGEATAERIADNNAMLDKLEALLGERSALYIPQWTAVEQRMNAERCMGRFEEADRMHKRFAAITARRVNPEYAAIRARIDREADASAQLNAVANKVCDDIFNTVPVVRGAVLEAAE